MLVLRIALVAAFALLSVGVHAGSGTESNCGSKNTADARDCYLAQNGQIEARLKQAVVKKLRSLNYNATFKEEGWSKNQVVELKRAFIQSQAHWEKYRDYWCEYKGRGINGSGADNATLSCEIEFTSQRIRDIGE